MAASEAINLISTKNHHPNKMSSEMTFDITLHGLLLWASLGFLMPLGTLIIRMSHREHSPIRLKVFFYFHLAIQMLGVLVATAGAILSIKTFENSFNNYHQRIGVVLYGAIWLQAILGFCRSPRGSKKRGAWYMTHWILGTTIIIIGIMNIYTGLEAYKKRTPSSSRTINFWVILFTAQVSVMTFLFLLQDKWHYIKRQSVIGQGPVVGPSSDQESPSRDHNNNNDTNLWREPCPKANALKNLFH